MKFSHHVATAVFMCLFSAPSAQIFAQRKSQQNELGRIIVSENKRFLQFENGKPFFYLGDTAWELFHRLKKEEAQSYFENRASKGFTVIQAVAIAEFEGLTTPNAYGFLPFINEDPMKPDIKTGDNNDYWDIVETMVRDANARGLYVGMLPCWGKYWHDGNRPLFNIKSAEFYGQFLGERFKNAKIIWILGGDRTPENDYHKDIIRAMAKGLKLGDDSTHLITFHPAGESGSAQFFHNEEWLDFNMRQNGHSCFYSSYAQTLEDFNRSPQKPIIDGEPLYEDHPIAFNAPTFGHSCAADVRRALYWDLFNGAMGHTYGHHSVWQMYEEGKTAAINLPLINWQEALHSQGAAQMHHARKLLESRPYFNRIPATNEVIVASRVATAIPGAGLSRMVATRDLEGTYAMIYLPEGKNFSVRLEVIKNSKVRASWFNPRNGKSTLIGTFENEGNKLFESPNEGEMLDWILILDDASKRYPLWD